MLSDLAISGTQSYAAASYTLDSDSGELKKKAAVALLSTANFLDHPIAESTSISRRLNIVSSGASDGVVQSASEIVNTLKIAGEEMSSAPLKTSVQFLKNHWHEAAMGAAITFLNPPKWANAALIVYSLKGYGAAGYEAFQQAADPKADATEIKSNLSNAIAQESSAMLFSLPMTLAGGIAGRSAANALIGKDMGAIELITGKVKAQQIQHNFFEIKDKVSPPAVKLVVADLDNTMAPFSRYYARGFKQAAAELSVNSKIPESELYKLIGSAMEIKKGRDYPWLIELALGEKLKVGQPGHLSPAEFQTKLVEPFWKTMDKAMAEHYTLYPRVLETLQELKKREIPVAIITDASAPVGLRRFSQLGVDKNGLVDRMYALDYKVPEILPREMIAGGQNRIDAMINTSHGLKELKAFPAELEKPNPASLHALLKEYNLRPSQVLVIGDRQSKDVALAVNVGARSILAKYGEPHPADKAIVTQLKPRKPDGPFDKQFDAINHATKPTPFLEAASSFESVLSHLNPASNFSALSAEAIRAMTLRPNVGAGVIGVGILDDKDSWKYPANYFNKESVTGLIALNMRS